MTASQLVLAAAIALLAITPWVVRWIERGEREQAHSARISRALDVLAALPRRESERESSTTTRNAPRSPDERN